jgi:hypothetical protein
MGALRCCSHLVSLVRLILRALNLRWRTSPANASLVSFSMESYPTSIKLPILDQPDRSSPSIGTGVKSSVGSWKDLPRYDLTRSALKWRARPHARQSAVRLDDGARCLDSQTYGSRAGSDPARRRCVARPTAGGGRNLGHSRRRHSEEPTSISEFWPVVWTGCCSARPRAAIDFKHTVAPEMSLCDPRPLGGRS